MYTRREFGKLTLAGLSVPVVGGVISSKVNGVRLGVQTYSFRDLPRTPGGDAVDTVINAMKECGFAECELYAPQVEPLENLRAWRLETPLEHFRAIKRKFDAAGITVYAYNYSFNDGFSEQEIDRGFDMAKALGAEIITASTTLPVAKKVVPFAEKHKMIVAMHGHSNTTDPDQFASPDSFVAAMKMSRYFRINLDIGHFTAANFDAVAFLREHHAKVTNLHIKDMKRRHRDEYVPWGQGDAPIKEVLQLLKRERWPIRAYIEYEYPGEGTPVEETKKCLAYVQQALA